LRSIATHYERLRVSPTATTQQIRDAYRRAAREAHPDHDVRAGAEARMAAINEAYRILGDPTRRSRYDEEIASASRPAPTYTRPDREAEPDIFFPVPDATPARFPWRFMAFLATMGIALIIAGLIFTKPAPPAEPDNILRSADCVDLGPQLDAAEVACSEPHDAVVDVLVPFGDTCPRDSEPYRDRQGMGTACVVRVGP
jgi:hypothetical protein